MTDIVRDREIARLEEEVRQLRDERLWISNAWRSKAAELSDMNEHLIAQLSEKKDTVRRIMARLYELEGFARSHGGPPLVTGGLVMPEHVAEGLEFEVFYLRDQLEAAKKEAAEARQEVYNLKMSIAEWTKWEL